MFSNANMINIRIKRKKKQITNITYPKEITHLKNTLCKSILLQIQVCRQKVTVILKAD